VCHGRVGRAGDVRLGASVCHGRVGRAAGLRPAALLLAIILASPAPAQQPVTKPAAQQPATKPAWWNADWPCRARIDCKPGEGDVAHVRVLLAGRTTPDARDLRLIDPDGRPRPFLIVHHDPQLSTLLQFQVPPDKPQTTWLYYGNTQAPAIKTNNPLFGSFQEQWDAWRKNQVARREALDKRTALEQEREYLRVRLREAESAGRTGGSVDSARKRLAEIEQELAAIVVPDALPEPKSSSAWYAKRGVLLRVYRKAKPGHPNELRDLRKMIGEAALEGAGFRAAISDGSNPFGVSENYISVYEGYLRIEKPGEYAFCTVSDDGSWALINEKPVVSWPGGHGIGGGERGEKHNTVNLKEGVAFVQYYQEEDNGGQMAFLGWKPPGADHFDAVPKEQWLAVRQASPALYEAREKRLLAVGGGEIDSTYWIRDTEDLQTTMVAFHDHSRSRAGEIQEARWTFGDGLTGQGREVTHAYFRLGRPQVTLTVTDAAGNTDAVTFAPPVHQMDAVARSRKFGEAPDYVQATADYDVERFERDDLALYAEFCGNLEQWPQHVRAAKAYLRRFPDAPGAAQLAVSGAESCLHPQAYDPQAADQLLALALKGAPTPRDRYSLLLRRAHVLTWHLNDPAQGRQLLEEVQKAVGAQTGRPFDALRRQCLIGLGDAAVVAADYAAAEKLYRQAEDARAEPIKQPEKLAKIGSYEYTVDDLLARGEYAAARQVLDEWEEQFPLQKLEGRTFFWRGKVLFVEQPGAQALRYLELAERVAPRAIHVPEAVWLRANCCIALQRYDDALAELKRIATDFTYSEFLQQAQEKIKECQVKLAEKKK